MPSPVIRIRINSPAPERHPEEILFEEMGDLIRRYGFRFLRAEERDAIRYREAIRDHKVFRALSADPELWERALDRLRAEFGEEVTGELMKKLGDPDHGGGRVRIHFPAA
jgi:hypothetical protein